jgi:uncharacterized surface protein with fasciclin (FAS1) repeats
MIQEIPMRKTLLVGLAAMFGVVAAAPATASADTKPTLADILLSDAAQDNANGFDSRWYDYDIVTQAVLAFPDLTAAAADPNGSLTVFLPKDYAFFRLAKQLGAPAANEEATFNWLVANVGLPTIKNVLMYHIVPGAKISYAAALGADGAKLGTLLDPAATIEVDVRSGDRIKLIDLDTNDRDAYVIKRDIGGEAANGFAHGIGRVLRPIDLP